MVASLPLFLFNLGRVVGWRRCSKLCNILEVDLGKANKKADGERMDRLWAAAKEIGDSADRGVMGGRGSGGGGTDLPEMYCDVLFVERTEDGDNTMEIDGE